MSRSRAAKLCKERDGRLCTELEWERACTGPDGEMYAGGARWDSACAKAPNTCASGYGALAMGAALAVGVTGFAMADTIKAEKGKEANLVLLPKFLGILPFDALPSRKLPV